MANTTWNPADKTTDCVLSNLNLTARANQFGTQSCRSIYGIATGKYYWECTFVDTGNTACGIAALATTLTGTGTSGVAGTAYVNNAGGSILINGPAGGASLGAFSAGQIACIALDLNAQLIWFRKAPAGNWNNSGTANPASGAGGFALTFVGAGVAAYALYSSANATPNGLVTANFGDSAFTGVAPSGFAAGFPGTAAVTANAVRAMVLA
jgi:hypothetical protein